MDNQKDIKHEEEEGNIIDVEPEQTPPFSEAPAEAATANKPQRFQLPLVVAVVALVAVAGTGIYGYRYWQNISQDLHDMQQRISSTLSEQQRLVSEIETAKKVLADHKKRLAEQDSLAATQNELLATEKQELGLQAQAMQKTVEEINAKVGRTDNQWQLAEADYLMRVANHRLALTQDINTALTALMQADEKLRSSGDLGLINVREKLAEEISALKAISAPDIAGASATLQALAAQVPSLKLAGATLKRTQNNETTVATAKSGRNFDTLLEDSWRGFQELVVIRKHDKPVSAMLPPSQQFFLFQNLQLQLESARLALLRQESILFKSSIDTARQWLESFFDGGDTHTANMLTTLSELEQLSFSNEMPDISASLNLLTRYREQKQ